MVNMRCTGQPFSSADDVTCRGILKEQSSGFIQYRFPAIETSFFPTHTVDESLRMLVATTVTFDLRPRA